MASPYKKLKLANQGWVGFTNISKLDPNKAYRMLGLVETNHAQYGPGQQATIQAHDGRKWRTQLPGKYLSQLSSEDIVRMKHDIANHHNIFLVFRERMIDNSYRIDITDNDAVVHNYVANTDVPELEVSIEEEKEETSNENGSSSPSDPAEDVVKNKNEVEGKSEDSKEEEEGSGSSG